MRKGGREGGGGRRGRERISYSARLLHIQRPRAEQAAVFITRRNAAWGVFVHLNEIPHAINPGPRRPAPTNTPPRDAKQVEFKYSQAFPRRRTWWGGVGTRVGSNYFGAHGSGASLLLSRRRAGQVAGALLGFMARPKPRDLVGFLF